jgi:hypothetical protein
LTWTRTVSQNGQVMLGGYPYGLAVYKHDIVRGSLLTTSYAL